MEPIARIHTDFPQKFGIPRQSGIVDDLRGTIVFEPAFRNEDAVRGLEGFSHIWLIWEFQDTEREGGWSPTVRPPLLGGNKRMGVFATRSPFRPNPIGLSSVRLEAVEATEDGPVLIVRGVDLRDGTPIYDIKPYLPQTDCHPDATAGFTEETEWRQLDVELPKALTSDMGEETRAQLIAVLAEDPRPARQRGSVRDYALSFAGYNVAFTVDDEAGALIVKEIERA